MTQTGTAAAGLDDLLLAAGIDLAADLGDGPVRFECLRAAQRIQRALASPGPGGGPRVGGASLGLLPASANVGVVGVGVHLALALAELSGSPVGYVDANLRWPALAPPAPVRDDSGEQSFGGSAFFTRWLRGDVAVLVPHRKSLAGAGATALPRLLASARELFAGCLVDLTGWQRLGEHLQAFDLLDGVVLVAHAGRSTEEELLRLDAEIPPHKHLGVLLLGADPPG